jgi:hypothetical protein
MGTTLSAPPTEPNNTTVHHGLMLEYNGRRSCTPGGGSTSAPDAYDADPADLDELVGYVLEPATRAEAIPRRSDPTALAAVGARSNQPQVSSELLDNRRVIESIRRR